ncbi:metal ABC transporter ATP-binding protein [Oceanivirga salmonicida]|uniref:metal ABC transporter ATP-binding protein n=1 Tax=Oceanivirga salmonicida TaxID=1769291 RepID=UPI0008336688|nr:metal ABC transporter ATP-binding protein [Oceanivirga salmonicida]
MTNGITLKVKNLSLTLGNTHILENINLEIKSGEIHAIIGPNGGGKTSFLKCILGQVPYDGEIFIEYKDDKRIGYVPQVLDFERSLPITVEDFLCLCYQNKPSFLGPNKKNKELFKQILKEVGLEDKKKRLLGNLSGGELQRLLLAQSINPRPNLLILDEPFTGVDSVGEEYFIEIIKKLKDEGITIIWINHNINQVRKIADTVTCIKKQICFSCEKHEELSKEELLDIYL